MSDLLDYSALDGSAAQGVVWSPGPLRHTLWVLPESGSREAVVVRVPVKAGEGYQEVDWSFQAEVVKRHGDIANNPSFRETYAQTTRLAMAHAPALPPKLWRASLEPGLA